MTETGATEFIVGLISSGIFLWLWPIASTMQLLVSSGYSQNLANTPIIVSTATLVFCVSLFGLIAAYCLGICIEKLVIYIHKQVKHNND